MIHVSVDEKKRAKLRQLYLAREKLDREYNSGGLLPRTYRRRRKKICHGILEMLQQGNESKRKEG
jgi:hypothetical protein